MLRALDVLFSVSALLEQSVAIKRSDLIVFLTPQKKNKVAYLEELERLILYNFYGKYIK